MIRDLESERKQMAQNARKSLLAYGAYAESIKNYAEPNYSKHKLDGYLHNLNFDGEEFSFVSSRDAAFIFDGFSEAEITTFINSFIARLKEIGFRNVLVRKEWIVEKKKDPYAFINIPRKTGRAGYIIYFSVVW